MEGRLVRAFYDGAECPPSFYDSVFEMVSRNEFVAYKFEVYRLHLLSS